MPDRPALGGDWEEIWRSPGTVAFVDPDGVVQYTLLLDNATAATKVALFLEQHKEPLMMENAHFEPLRARRPRGAVLPGP